MVKPTRIGNIPAYLRAVTILQPEGNIAAEVTEAIESWGKPATFNTTRQVKYLRIGTLLTLLLGSLFVAIGLGTLFSLAYPSVEITVSLASLLTLVAVLIVSAVRGLWKTLGHGSTRWKNSE